MSLAITTTIDENDRLPVNSKTIVNSGTVFCSLRDLGLIRVSGEDAGTFLQAQLTSDVNSLAKNASQYSGYCTPKGRLLGSFLLLRTERMFYLQLPDSLRESIQKRLSIYILRAKVQASDASGEFTCFGIAGKGAETTLQQILGKIPGSPHEVEYNESVMIVRLPGDRFELIVPRERDGAISEVLAKVGRSGAQEYWNWLTIRAGIPVITPETREEFVPQMVNFDAIGAVSLNKGCYPGQEIVARMHYLGRLKQRMYLVHLAEDTAPRPGDKLYSADLGEQASGTVVNAASSPDGGYDMLAVIQIKSAEGEAIHWKWPDGPMLQLLSLPYRL